MGCDKVRTVGCGEPWESVLGEKEEEEVQLPVRLCSEYWDVCEPIEEERREEEGRRRREGERGKGEREKRKREGTKSS